MQISLKHKTAIVTGASRGIGKEIALKFGSLGASVAVNYLHRKQEAEQICAQITDMGGNAIPVQADMRDVAAIELMVDMTINTFGSLDILVNNAGIMICKPIQDLTEQEFDTLFTSNVKGVFFACQQAAKKMADGGTIINISSSATKLMMPTYGAYAATKGAVEQITKILAKELGPRQIQVNAISPGPVDTELFRQGKSDELINSLADMAALGRIGTPQDIANAAALLASDDAGWITGQNICVNGGFVS